MTKKIFRSTLMVAAVVLLCSLAVIMSCLYDYFASVQETQLRDELSLAAAGVEQSGMQFLEAVEPDRFRITWVAVDGRVLYDTQAAAGDMENHGEREEIREALADGTGSSARVSATLTEKTLYEAKRLSDGTVLRVSIRRSTLVVLALGMLQPIVLVALAAAALSALLAKRVAKKIVQPLDRLDLERPLDNETYEELAPVLHRLHSQHMQIKAQLLELRRKNREFAHITEHMREGLVLLDSQGTVLSINPAACRLFQTDGGCVGKSMLAVDRHHDMTQALEQAMAQGYSALRARRGGRDYQFDVSRIRSGETTQGAVVLAVDVTEQLAAERSRREFTANVSHELKTPLQSIMGSAELLEHGLVQPEDQPRFVGRIRREAARLLALIEDIIRLSQLDEGVELPREPVSLRALAQEVFATLQDAAGAKGVVLRLDGEGQVYGVRRLLYEIVYNLCDNAVKYNVEGGSVTLTITQAEGRTALTVADTGIGIPAEHRERVFERFYRVDKSHSKQSGGTGLGLSIVKHAVQYHHGQLRLDSQPGQGTSITVTFEEHA